MKKILFLSVGLISFSLILFNAGCDSIISTTEGTIEYGSEIINKDHPMAFVAPSKMTVQFKNSVCKGELSAAAGFFTTTFIADPEKKEVTQLVRLVNSKMAHVFDRKKVEKLNENVYPPFKVEKTKETKEIAGYKCKKAKIIFDNKKHENFDIYYTNAINIKNPNWSTPFHDIDGVMLEYQLLKYGMELRFTAKKIDKNPLENDTFKIPAGYKTVPEKEIDDLFKSLQ